MRFHQLPWFPAAMMVASALMGTLEAVFLRLLGDAGSQAQVLLFRSGMQLLLVAAVGTAMTGGWSPCRKRSGCANICCAGRWQRCRGGVTT